VPTIDLKVVQLLSCRDAPLLKLIRHRTEAELEIIGVDDLACSPFFSILLVNVVGYVAVVRWREL
jgi:hypothetical protein